MKTLITWILICFMWTIVCFTSIAYSQENTSKNIIISLPCDSVENVYGVVASGREGLLFSSRGYVLEATTGQFYPGKTMTFVNQDTGRSSIIMVFEDGMACLLMPGADFEPFTGNQPWDLEKDNL